MREGRALAKAGYTRTKDLWNPEAQTWKNLVKLIMMNHPSNR
jgi:hypothetical protein